MTRLGNFRLITSTPTVGVRIVASLSFLIVNCFINTANIIFDKGSTSIFKTAKNSKSFSTTDAREVHFLFISSPGFFSTDHGSGSVSIAGRM